MYVEGTNSYGIHVSLPEELLREIDALVGKGGRSKFVTELATREVKRRKLMALLKTPGPLRVKRAASRTMR